ncbi:hypothetical protein HA402_004547, partial [Bradysia odoriphaga]
VRANCTELVTKCAWNDQVFDCCKYFQPLKTTLGTCFLINSRQLTPKDGPNWLNTKMDLRTGPGSMRLEFSKAVSLQYMCYGMFKGRPAESLQLYPPQHDLR